MEILKGGVIMTIGTKMQQTIAGLESACASLKGFALDTEDQQAKQQFQQISQSLESSIQTLKQRQQYIEQEEPQYRQQ